LVPVQENASEPKPVLGFFSLNLCQIKPGTLPAEDAGKLPRDVSGIRLGRLAVATAHQRQGAGKTLLVAAMRKFMEIFSAAGGIGLFVDAKDHEAKRYYEQFGFVSLPSNELELFLPVKTMQEALTPPEATGTVAEQTHFQLKRPHQSHGRPRLLAGPIQVIPNGHRDSV
jgi:hypothetical protein